MASSIRAAVRVACAALAAAPALAFAQPPHVSDLTAAGAAEVRGFLDANGSPDPLCTTADGRAVWAAVQAFYSGRGDRPVWMAGHRLTSAGERLVTLLRGSVDEGLEPHRYDPAVLTSPASQVLRASQAEEPLGRQAAQWEVGLTAALARYASDVGRGRVDPARGGGMWRGRRAAIDILSVLQEAADSGRPDQVLDGIRPVHPQYDALRGALRRFAALAHGEADVPRLPKGLKLRPGARSPHVPALRARLAFWGDLGQDAGGFLLDRPTAQALQRFEARHGLAADGALDPEAVAALNTSARDRMRQIALNLERWRWQDRTRARRSLLVNIPTFTLHAYDAGVEVLTMRTITGQADTPTPVFDEQMTSVVFSPYWNVPPNITRGETLPAVRRDRGYLRRMNLEVLRGGTVVDPGQVDWRRDVARLSFRQRPGAGNALGLVKFRLPNPFNVYLHDTPSDSLFRRARRTLSHGCVRLEKPEALARWVLSDRPEWTPERISAAMRAGRERAVSVSDPIAVSIAYFTVWVDAEGGVQFRPDVYRHDLAQGALLDALEGPRPAGAAAVAAAEE